MGRKNYAKYKDMEYSAGQKQDGSIVLRSKDPSVLKLNFIKKTDGHDTIYVKCVQREDLQEYYEKTMVALYCGYEFEVAQENGDEIELITMHGDYRTWEIWVWQVLIRGYTINGLSEMKLKL